MDNKVKAFPHTHYPQTYNPHSNKRELFIGWGSVMGLDVKGDDKDGTEFLAQYPRQLGPWDALCAKTASMPLLQHNPYPGYIVEPCMALKNRKKEALLRACPRLKLAKGRVKNNKQTGEIRKTLRLMQRQTNPELLPTDRPPPDSDSSGTESELINSDNSSSGESSDDDEDAGNKPRPSMLYLSYLCHINFKDLIDKSPDVLHEDCQALEINSLYTGGSLATIQHSDERGLVVTPRGPELQNLYITSYTVEDHTLTVTDTESTSITMDSHIYQIDGKVTQGQVFIGVREEKKCQVMVVDPDSIETRVIHSCGWEEQDVLTSIAVSPHIAGETLMSTQKLGQGFVHHLNQPLGSESTLVAGPFEERFSGTGDWSQCYWGPHPRQFAAADRTGVALWDIRASPAPSTDLFSIPHQTLHAWERVMTARLHPTQPFYHTLATDYSLILMDSRFPNHTVLKWSHSLLSLPQYIEVIPGVFSEGEDLVLIGSQHIPEVHAYPINMSLHSTTSPLAAGSPWRVSRMTDFAHLACRVEPTMTENLISSRLDVPLVGIGGVPHSRQNPGVSVLQLSSTGNLFCQDYCQSLSDDITDKTWCTGPGSSKIRLCDNDYSKAHHWLKCLVEDKSLNLPLQKLKKIDVTETLEGSTSAQLDPHILCGFCSSIFSHQNETEGPRDERTSNQRCFRCTNAIGYTDKLRDASRKDRVIMSESEDVGLPEKLRSLNLDPAVYDTTTQIVFKLWHKEDVTDLVNTRNQQREAEIMEKFTKWKEKKLQEQAGNLSPPTSGREIGAEDMVETEDMEPTSSTSEINHSAPPGEQPHLDISERPDTSRQCSESSGSQGGIDTPENVAVPGRSRHFSVPISMHRISHITSHFASPPRTLPRTPPHTSPRTPPRSRHYSTSSYESATFSMGFASTPRTLKNKSQKQSSVCLTSPIVTPTVLERSCAKILASGDTRQMQPPPKKKSKKYSLGF